MKIYSELYTFHGVKFNDTQWKFEVILEKCGVKVLGSVKSPFLVQNLIGFRTDEKLSARKQEKVRDAFGPYRDYDFLYGLKHCSKNAYQSIGDLWPEAVSGEVTQFEPKSTSGKRYGERHKLPQRNSRSQLSHQSRHCSRRRQHSNSSHRRSQLASLSHSQHNYDSRDYYSRGRSRSNSSDFHRSTPNSRIRKRTKKKIHVKTGWTDEEFEWDQEEINPVEPEISNHGQLQEKIADLERQVALLKQQVLKL